MGFPSVWEGKWYEQSSVIFRIYWEEKAFIWSGSSSTLQKSHWWCRKGTRCVQKHSINVSCMGGRSFSCDHAAGWRGPGWPRACGTARATTACSARAGLGDWTPVNAPQLWTGRTNFQWRLSCCGWAALKASCCCARVWNPAGDGPACPSTGQTCSSACEGLTNEGWRVIPSL